RRLHAHHGVAALLHFGDLARDEPLVDVAVLQGKADWSTRDLRATDVHRASSPFGLRREARAPTTDHGGDHDSWALFGRRGPAPRRPAARTTLAAPPDASAAAAPRQAGLCAAGRRGLGPAGRGAPGPWRRLTVARASNLTRRRRDITFRSHSHEQE